MLLTGVDFCTVRGSAGKSGTALLGVAVRASNVIARAGGGVTGVTTAVLAGCTI